MCLKEKFWPYFLSLIHFFIQILDYKSNISDIARANCNCKRVFFLFTVRWFNFASIFSTFASPSFLVAVPFAV